MAVALITIPFLTGVLGVERFGILALGWLVVGYFGIFDMGIGRATTKSVAETLALGDAERLPTIVWNSLLMLAGFGLVAALSALLVIPWLIGHVLSIPPDLAGEAQTAFLLLAVSIPFVFGTSGARGVLEGQQRFGIENVVRICSASFNFIGPLLVLPFSRNLVHIMLVLVSGRVIVFIVHLILVVRSLPHPRWPGSPDGRTIRSLLGFGGWLTVTNILGSVMALGCVDRLVIGSCIGMAAVAYYSTPFEMLTKLLFFSAGFLGALFPVFSAHSLVNWQRVRELHERAARYLVAFMSLLVAPIIVFAEPFLNLWLGGEFARESTLPLKIIAVGVLVGAVSFLPTGALQALGRPDLTAKRHFVILPVYCALMWWGITQWSVVGAAGVWTAWVLLDTTVLFRLLSGVAPANLNRCRRHGTTVSIGVPTLLIAGAFVVSTVPSLRIRAAAIGGMMVAFAAVWWLGVFDRRDRGQVLGLVGMAAQLCGHLRAVRSAETAGRST